MRQGAALNEHTACTATQQGREHRSRRGNARLRLAFWMAGMVTVCTKETFDTEARNIDN